MVKTIAQLKREIASQKNIISKEQKFSDIISEKQKLSRQLFELRNRRLIGAGSKARRLSKRLGKTLLNIGKKVAPIIKKQAKLIREQQLRDDALTMARLKKRNPLQTKTIEKFVPIKRKGKKTLFKRVKTKVKFSKPIIKKQDNQGIFGNLDF